MGVAIYAFVFAVVMAMNAVTTRNGVLSIIDYIAMAWLFFAGATQTVHYYKSKDIIEVNFYDED